MIITKSEPFTKEEIEKLKDSLASLAMDLNRVAIGINRGSEIMAKRFFQEALTRKSEISQDEIPVYIKKIMAKINENKSLNQEFAEEVLVYSILIENYVTKRLI